MSSKYIWPWLLYCSHGISSIWKFGHNAMISHYQVYFTTEIVKYVVNNIIRDREDIQLRNITRNCWKKTPRAFCFMGLITKKDWFVFGPSVRSRSLQPSWDILISINSHKVRNLILFLQNTITISRNRNRNIFPWSWKSSHYFKSVLDNKCYWCELSAKF